MKKCKECGEEKPLSEYHFTNKTKGYRGSYCKKCFKIKNNKSVAKWQNKNYDKVKEYNKTYSLEYHYKHHNTRKKINKEYYYNQKDGLHYVYYIPEHHYIGVTDNLRFRKYEHKNGKNNRIIDGFEIVHKTPHRSEALKVESKLHSMGYQG